MGNYVTTGYELSIFWEINKNRTIPFQVILQKIPNRSNYSLEEAPTPLLNLLKDYIKNYPPELIHIIGVSNVYRISM